MSSKSKSTAAKEFVLSRAQTHLKEILSAERSRLKDTLPTTDPIDDTLHNLSIECGTATKALEAQIQTTVDSFFQKALKLSGLPHYHGYYRNVEGVREEYRRLQPDRIEEALKNHPAKRAYEDFELAVMCSDNQDLVTMLSDFTTRLSFFARPKESTKNIIIRSKETGQTLQVPNLAAKRPTKPPKK